MVTVSKIAPMALTMKETGRMIKLMAVEHTSGLMEDVIKVIG